MPKHQTIPRSLSWLLISLSILFILAWQAPPIHALQGNAIMSLSMHITAETFSIVVSMLAFGVAWNAYNKERAGNVVILGCLLLTVGFIDFAHTLSFNGMPSFITPSSKEKALNFWLSARAIFALGLLVVALRPWQPFEQQNHRYLWLTAALSSTALVYWLGLYHADIWPRTFVDGHGLTHFKIVAEYTISTLLLISAILLYRQIQFARNNITSLFAATVILILSELCFTLYSDVTDIFNLLGHVYKVIAYLFIYHAIFVDSVREPFTRLDRELAEKQQLMTELNRHKLHLEEQVTQRTLDLASAKLAAESANHAKSMFIANMSHELRTPLNAILGFTQLMSHDVAMSANQQQQLRIINRAGEHLLAMINEVLDISKIEAGHMHLENHAIDLPQLINDIGLMIRSRAEGKGLNFIIEIDDSVPQYVNTDVGKLRQILVNLLGNAVKFTDQGGITLRSKCDASLLLILEIEDTGPGIPAELLPNIFEPFIQGSHAQRQGTGLGLTITRNLIQLMKGKIEVESIYGKGSIFRCQLPLTLANSSDLPSPTISELEITGLENPATSPKILIVEDNEANRLLLSSILQRIGFHVDTASNGQEGIEHFIQQQPDFIWMDIRMPIMNGYQATQHIRQLPSGKQVKIVALTASAFKQERDNMLSYGFDDVLCKPFREADIFGCMEKLLGVHYRYATTPSSATTNTIPLDANLLQQLPSDVIATLQAATLRCSLSKFKDALAPIQHSHPEIATALINLAENYRFDELISLFEQRMDDTSS